jgi:hypothetical protein
LGLNIPRSNIVAAHPPFEVWQSWEATISDYVPESPPMKLLRAATSKSVFDCLTRFINAERLSLETVSIAAALHARH